MHGDQVQLFQCQELFHRIYICMHIHIYLSLCFLLHAKGGSTLAMHCVKREDFFEAMFKEIMEEKIKRGKWDWDKARTIYSKPCLHHHVFICLSLVALSPHSSQLGSLVCLSDKWACSSFHALSFPLHTPHQTLPLEVSFSL